MHVINNTIKDQRKIAYVFWALVLLVLVFAGAYLFLINRTVMNIVERQNAESKINAMSSTVGQLESQNLALTGKITPEYAASLGFVQPENPHYITYDGNVSGNASALVSLK